MSTASDGVLAGSRLGYSYGTHLALREVSVSLRRGEALAVVGPNGSGKTTLLTLLSGLRRPDSGAVTVDGRDLPALPARSRAQRIAVVSQHVDPGVMLSVEHVVSMGRAPHSGLLRPLTAGDKDAVREALDDADCTHLAQRRFGELSGGEQQRVMLAMALAQSAPYLLLDEPTVHLDLEHQHAFLELLVTLHRSKRIGILAVTHDLNLAALYFDRIAVLSAGQLIADGTPSHLLQREDVLGVFRAPLSVVEHPDAKVPQVLLRPGPAKS